MNFLYKYKLTIKLFTEYLIEKRYPAKDILTRDFTSNVGVLLEFLSLHGVYCVVDCYNILVYTDGITPHTEHYIKKNSTIYIIKETDNKERKDIIHNYMSAINASFNFLDNPF